MAYITPADLLDRLPAGEAQRLGLDDAKATAAIADQDQIIDSYLAGRYALPLVGTHPILEGISAALTREALHRERPTVAVTEQADRARGQLRDLAAGRATIPIAAGQPALVINPDDLAVRANDGRPRVFTSDSLADFTSLGGLGGRTVFDGPRGW